MKGFRYYPFLDFSFWVFSSIRSHGNRCPFNARRVQPRGTQAIRVSTLPPLPSRKQQSGLIVIFLKRATQLYGESIRPHIPCCRFLRDHELWLSFHYISLHYLWPAGNYIPRRFMHLRSRDATRDPCGSAVFPISLFLPRIRDTIHWVSSIIAKIWILAASKQKQWISINKRLLFNHPSGSF